MVIRFLTGSNLRLLCREEEEWNVVEREFGAFAGIADHYPQYVVSRDRTTLARDGIVHRTLTDFLLSGK